LLVSLEKRSWRTHSWGLELAFSRVFLRGIKEGIV
jgi:hypothetical protein